MLLLDAVQKIIQQTTEMTGVRTLNILIESSDRFHETLALSAEEEVLRSVTLNKRLFT